MGWIRDLLLGEDDGQDQGTHTETVPIQPRGRCNTHGRYDKAGDAYRDVTGGTLVVVRVGGRLSCPVSASNPGTQLNRFVDFPRDTPLRPPRTSTGAGCFTVLTSDTLGTKLLV